MRNSANDNRRSIFSPSPEQQQFFDSMRSMYILGVSTAMTLFTAPGWLLLYGPIYPQAVRKRAA